MQFQHLYICVLLFVTGSHFIGAEVFDFERNDAVSNQTATAYSTGVQMGIINPEKYSLESFERDERNIFRDSYQEYKSLNGSQPISYQEWLILNNYGILSDTQESLFQRKIVKRSTADNKRRFINTVRKGDILITSGPGIGGFIGHAAIMTTNTWVLEMPGGPGYMNGIPNNNRQIQKDRWFNEHASDWTTVYRNRDSTVAAQAARWADRHYYDKNGGAKKTIHVTYKIFPPAFRSFNPSYCSKLVLQAFYYGTGSKAVVKDPQATPIVPNTIPAYFLPPYTLKNMGKF